MRPPLLGTGTMNIKSCVDFLQSEFRKYEIDREEWNRERRVVAPSESGHTRVTRAPLDPRNTLEPSPLRAAGFISRLESPLLKASIGDAPFRLVTPLSQSAFFANASRTLLAPCRREEGAGGRPLRPHPPSEDARVCSASRKASLLWMEKRQRLSKLDEIGRFLPALPH